ncbi:transcription elongation factor [Salmonella enterica subsp. enterica]|uniref:Transcription elongation factor n=1 Tax=Salmonella enterica I TaxID=59201 RepID=A0A3S4LRK8_SALET|nr:transcription elongation factor [Salmonella enterica subsp. enterica]
MQAIPMTLRGAEKLREELDFLKSVRRPEIIAAIAESARTWRFKRKTRSIMLHANSRVSAKGALKDIEAKTVECAGD